MEEIIIQLTKPCFGQLWTMYRYPRRLTWRQFKNERIWFNKKTGCLEKSIVYGSLSYRPLRTRPITYYWDIVIVLLWKYNIINVRASGFFSVDLSWFAALPFIMYTGTVYLHSLGYLLSGHVMLVLLKGSDEKWRLF